MAVGFGAASESHTGTAGNSGAASFTWNHDSTGDRCAVVFVFTIAATAVETGVTFGGTAMTAVSGGQAIDNATEAGTVTAYFLDNITQGATTAVVVNRTNNATVAYATCQTFTAAVACGTNGVVLLQNDGAIAEQSVTDGSPGTNSMRVAGCYYGGASPAPQGAASTLDASIDLGAFGCSTVHETTAGQGARNVGFTQATSDDRAVVHFAVREIPDTQGVTQAAYTATEATPGAQTGPSWAITPTANAVSIVWVGALATTAVTPAALSGSAAGTGGTTGALTAAPKLSGTSVGTGATTGALAASPQLSGASAGTGATTGALTAPSLITGTAAGAGATTGGLLAPTAQIDAYGVAVQALGPWGYWRVEEVPAQSADIEDVQGSSDWRFSTGGTPTMTRVASSIPNLTSRFMWSWPSTQSALNRINQPNTNVLFDRGSSGRPFTMIGWFRRPATLTSTFPSMLGLGDATDGVGLYLNAANGNLEISRRLATVAEGHTSGYVFPNDSAMHLVALVWTGSVFKIIVDSAGQVNSDWTPPGGMWANGVIPARFVGGSWGFNQTWEGEGDEFAFFPYALTTTNVSDLYTLGIASSANLTGTSASTGTATGALTASSLLSGTAAATGATTGALTAAPKLSGTAAGAGATTGTLGTAPLLSGTVAGVGATTGALTATPKLSGSAAGVGATTGTLSTNPKLSGTSAGTGTATGALTASPLLAGTSAGSGGTTGTVTTSLGISGTSAGTSTVTGALTASSLLSGTTAGVGATTGTLSTTPKLAGAAAGTGGTIGNLTVPVGVTQASYTAPKATAGAQTGPSWSITPDGANAVGIVWVGALASTAQPNISGAAAGTGGSTGALTAASAAQLTGTAAGVGGSSRADLGTPNPDLRATLPSITMSRFNASEVSAAPLSGTTAGTGATSGALTASPRLSGAAAGTGAATGTLSTTPKLSGASAGVGGTTGSVITAPTISGTTSGVGGSTGTLRVQPALSGLSAGVGASSGTIRTTPKIIGTAASIGGVAGTISVPARITGTAAGTGATVGLFASQAIIQDILHPTSLTLFANGTSLSLDTYTTGLSLVDQSTRLSLEHYIQNLVLADNGTDLALDARSTNLDIDENSQGLELEETGTGMTLDPD